MDSSTPLSFDIFCNVIDNFGDIGVCWRLARQLAVEHGFAVRLWVDDLASFKPLCPEIRDVAATQRVAGVEIRPWSGDFAGVIPHDVVIEAFACRLPECFEAAMATRTPKPVWINLDYLSAEDWVDGCHGLPSPHPRLPLTKHFFFPGFSEKTGGLLRESDLERRRVDFLNDPEARNQFLERLGIPTADDALLRISLFSYQNLSLIPLLEAWTMGARPITCLASLTRNRGDLERFAGRPLSVGDTVRKGRLALHITPFVPQTDYDELLWSCDLNFVRGEDSFVRAQWAAKPMIWHIYPQEEDTHHIKLDAFLDRYCAGLSKAAADHLRLFFHAWNENGTMTAALWGNFLEHLAELQRHAREWHKELIKQQDLCAKLVQFCRSRL
ncbi:elongation factor P maturation arginine rhamnosyltransferase EarP [Propionivibrio sp.]|uniref:elongation factor P maturation arginine rhamnosyltransferase EarP n=1 Tax=Propionivibrio sp. TaxID=2212460 RepID=UPI00272E6592|nr:elongation factor P maturation arginine rhamnosyltransferase EarP [Propionivibrio sp.]